MSRHRGSRSKNLVGFRVGEVRYAVDIQRVAEIINPLSVVSVPHAPDVVVGVAEHRGDVIPVLDMRRRFGLPASVLTRRTKWVIVRVETRQVALVVDAVTDVFGTAPSSRRPVPDLGPGGGARGVGAVHLHEGALVFVIDADLVCAPAQELDVDQVRAFTAKEASQ